MDITEARRQSHGNGLCEMIRSHVNCDRVMLLAYHNGKVDSEGRGFYWLSAQYSSQKKGVKPYIKENRKIPAGVYSSIVLNSIHSDLKGVALNMSDMEDTTLGALLYEEQVKTSMFLPVMRLNTEVPTVHGIIRCDWVEEEQQLSDNYPAQVFDHFYDRFLSDILDYVAKKL